MLMSKNNVESTIKKYKCAALLSNISRQFTNLKSNAIIFEFVDKLSQEEIDVKLLENQELSLGENTSGYVLCYYANVLDWIANTKLQEYIASKKIAYLYASYLYKLAILFGSSEAVERMADRYSQSANEELRANKKQAGFFEYLSYNIHSNKDDKLSEIFERLLHLNVATKVKWLTEKMLQIKDLIFSKGTNESVDEKSEITPEQFQQTKIFFDTHKNKHDTKYDLEYQNVFYEVEQFIFPVIILGSDLNYS